MIRQATQNDVTAIKETARAAYSIYVEAIGREPAPMIADFATQIEEKKVFVLEEIQVLGFIVLYSRNDHFHVENVAVHPNAQGKGLGLTLLSFADQHAQNLGFSAIELYTNEKMRENLTYYPKLGYVETDRRTEAGFNRVYFRKQL